MNWMIKAAFAMVAFGFAAGAQAAAYKCMDDKGRAVYSDIPCGKKEPPPKVEGPKILKPEIAPLTKLTEADVLRTLSLNEDYTRSYNAPDQCNLYAPDMKYLLNNQMAKPPRTVNAGRDEACQASKDNAEQLKKAGIVQVIERGPTKVSFEQGDTRANVIYDSVVRITRFDRVVSTYHCSAKEQLTVVGGKALFTATDVTCKP